MKISGLRTNQGNVEVEGTIKEIGETRSFNKFGKQLSVANAILKDDSGSIKLTLWNDDINRFKNGDKVKVSNGYVNEFQGEKQLTSGKFGKMEKIGESDAKDSDKSSGDSKDSSESSDKSSEDELEEIEEELEEEVY